MLGPILTVHKASGKYFGEIPVSYFVICLPLFIKVISNVPVKQNAGKCHVGIYNEFESLI